MALSPIIFPMGKSLFWRMLIISSKSCRVLSRPRKAAICEAVLLWLSLASTFAPYSRGVCTSPVDSLWTATCSAQTGVHNGKCRVTYQEPLYCNSPSNTWSFVEFKGSPTESTATAAMSSLLRKGLCTCRSHVNNFPATIWLAGHDSDIIWYMISEDSSNVPGSHPNSAVTSYSYFMRRRLQRS